uniref:Retrovirus-related Pol polyprotein from transposon 17.6 n=1 Tax=Cajanus cajan TaxID=3821 RepID=A0A151U959_CAJCA|nr:Retrovirus-related Pol polyprotein from transposon 17.6 [Cajanus cajan]
MILIDLRSSNNVLQPILASHLHLHTTSTPLYYDHLNHLHIILKLLVTKITTSLTSPCHNHTNLWGFLGLTNFYYRFIRVYATLASSHINILKLKLFKWFKDANISFTQLKNALTSTSILTLPDFSQVFSMEINASTKVIGAILSQEDHSIAFYTRELYAITKAVKKWH